MIEVVPVTTNKLRKTFLKFPWSIYQNDAHWVPPLLLERKQFLDPKKNPFFKTGKAELFVAFQNGHPVGRISAHTFPRHNEIHKDRVGFFGFFETINNPIVAQELVRTAEQWLAKEGCTHIRGPMSFTINDEIGTLIDGFDSRPYILMGHNPTYYPRLLESCGLGKIKDLYAWSYKPGAITPAAVELADATRATPGLEMRSLNMKKFEEEIRLLVKMFNEIWAQNWGFVPMTEEEVSHMAKELKPLIDPELTFFATVNGDPAALVLCLPDINELLATMNGSLFPLHWIKLLKKVVTRRWDGTRMAMLGVRKPYRGSAFGALSVLMNVEIHLRGLKRGLQKAELSWTLEDNERINRGIAFMGGKHYKTYRVYQKQI